MVVIVGDVTIDPDPSSEYTACHLTEWAIMAFPTLTGTPGGEEIRLPHHLTLIYHKRGVPSEAFLRATRMAGIDQFSFAGRVSGLLPVGNDQRGFIIMEFDEVQDLADAFLRTWEHIITETGETPKMARRPEEEYRTLHGFSAHITLASFPSLAAATEALAQVSEAAQIFYAKHFHHKLVTTNNYRVIE